MREHTRIGEAALRWDARGRAEALLFRSDELAAAKAWLTSPPQFAPEPTLLHHEFIKAAEDAEAARTFAERQRLDAMSAALEREKVAQSEREKALRQGQRALAAASGLFACIVFGALGWYNQQFLMEQYHWRVVMCQRQLRFRQNPTIRTSTFNAASIVGVSRREIEDSRFDGDQPWSTDTPPLRPMMFPLQEGTHGPGTPPQVQVLPEVILPRPV